MLAIDEFHHVSASEASRLGELLRSVITEHRRAYRRDDRLLLPRRRSPGADAEDEARFTKVTYNYYEQLNGYTHLKSLGIGYHFYQGRYTEAIHEVLDTDKKTILHIPSVHSGESTKDKIARWTPSSTRSASSRPGPETGIIGVRRPDGKVLKVADLVDDDPAQRPKIVEYLRTMREPDDMDLIIALGMAKEGFDWPFASTR